VVECVYSAVRTDSLYIKQITFRLLEVKYRFIYADILYSYLYALCIPYEILMVAEATVHFCTYYFKINIFYQCAFVRLLHKYNNINILYLMRLI